MDEEYNALLKNQTWILTDFPAQKKPIGCKWVYKVKLNTDGKVDRYKARLVAKGYSQEYGADYEETFAPIAKMTTIRTAIALASHFNWPIHQMDVKNAFLNGFLDEEIYMTQPPGYAVNGMEQKVCKLQKSLYGLK